MAEGWIKLHRQIRNHVFFKQKRTFSRFEAWVDMLLEANHCDKPWIVGNEVVTVERGSFVTSELKLMNRWGWSKAKVRAFLKLLQDEKMIVKKSDSKKTTISIVNYGVYQSEETAKRPQKDRKKTAKRPQKNTTKNVKNEKNVKKVIKEYTPLEKAIEDFKEHRTLIKSPMKGKAETLLRNELEKLAPGDDATKIAILNQSILSGWKGVFALKEGKSNPRSPDQKPIPRAYSSIQDAVERMKQYDT